MHEGIGLNNRKSLYSPLQPKPPFLQIDRPLTSDMDPLLCIKIQIYRFPSGFWIIGFLVLSKQAIKLYY
jgi:hypothetical protein